MKKLCLRSLIFCVCSVLVLASTASTAVHAAVITYPAPAGETSDAYTVPVDGQPVEVYTAQSGELFEGEYYFTYFDFSDSVKVEIRSKYSLDKSILLPPRYDFPLQVESDRAEFTANRPFRASFEPNGRVRPLLIFGNALETSAPRADEPGVVYFGPGVHKPGLIELKSNQTLYIAGGAVVKGCIRAAGENITICGRGILAGEDYPRFNGPGRFPLDCQNCNSVVIRDIILRNPWSWTAVIWNCRNVTIDGLKICSSRMINDDALDLVNSSDVIVRNCFFRTQDDSIAVKGCDASSKRPCENIRIEDCEFWTDVANIYRIGYECDTQRMANIVSRRIDILHYSVNLRPAEHYWANTLIWLQPNLNCVIGDCHFDDITVYSDGSDMLAVIARPMRCVYGEHKTPDPGMLRNCSIKNFRVYGIRGEFKGQIYITGISDTWNVDGVTFENLNYFGEPINGSSTNVQIGPFVKNVSFK